MLADGAVSGRRVLEVGAGSGAGHARAGARRGRRGRARLLARRRWRSSGARRGRQGDPCCSCAPTRCAMPFRDGAFDVVFHQGLLEHFRDPMPLLRENARVTPRGGRVVVDVPQTVPPLHADEAGADRVSTPGSPAGRRSSRPRQLEARCSRGGTARCVRTYGEWMVPGLCYRVLREALKRALGVCAAARSARPGVVGGVWQRDARGGCARGAGRSTRVT